MRYPDDFVEKVRDSSNLVEVISQYTQLKATGSNLMGLCPFPDHNEKSPSFSVSQSKQLYHCFGCKKSGNIFSFLQTYNGMNFPEAIEYLANRAQIPLPKLEEFSTEKQNQFDKNKEIKKRLFRINDFSNKFFRNSFKKLGPDHFVRKYAKERGLTEEIIEKFQIGYAIDAWEALSTDLNKNKAPLQEAQLLGLIKQRKDKSGFFDMFRNRLMFPILNPTGEVVGFGGRVLKKEDNPKYLNSPESPIFHKGRTLYGLHETAKHIRIEDRCIVVEGYMDLISLFRDGIQNTVANLGTAFTQEHAKLIKRYTKNVTVLFDGDSAGQTAAERALPILLQEGLYPNGLNLPEALDPDEFKEKYGVDALKEKLSSAQDLYFWYLDRKLKDYDGSPAQKVQIIDLIYPVLSVVSDKRLRELYIQETADRLQLDVNWLKTALRDMWRQKKQNNPNSPSSSQTKGGEAIFGTRHQQNLNNSKYLGIASAPKEELELFKLALAQEKYFNLLVAGEGFAGFSHETLSKIFTELASKYRQNTNNFDKLPALAVSYLKGNDSATITQNIHGDFYKEESQTQKLFEDCLRRLEKREKKLEIQRLRSQLKSEQDTETLKEYMKLFNSNKDSSNNESANER